MPIDFQIIDADLTGFGAPARARLKASIERFTADAIAESLRIEAGRNTASGTCEVTAAMVVDAVDSLNKGLAPKKSRWGTKAIRILAGVCPLAVGILYNPEKLQQPQNMFIFVVAVVAATFFIVLSVMKE